ncbi:MAG: allantoicase [Nitriliruptor sp.]
MNDPAPGATGVDERRGVFTGLIDLAARRLGGMVLSADDEFFAAKENLLDPIDPRFDADAYGDRGKVMDGWETRRRRDLPGVDRCVIRLGVPGVVDAVVVDTAFFRGNFPDAFELEGCVSEGGPPPEDVWWLSLVGRTSLRGDALQRFEVDQPRRATHVRFSIVPDGGVARLRILGRGLPDLHRAADGNGRLDLAAAVNGGRAVACSDEFFSSPHNLVMVGDARSMADGWETRRRRGPGEDRAVLELATTGTVERLEVDTTHFKGNYPDRIVIEATHQPEASPRDLLGAAAEWVTILPETLLQPHLQHVFDVEEPVEATHLRLRVLPDGGVARLRAFGVVSEAGWRRHGLAVLDAAADALAVAALLTCCGSTRWARELAARRPFGSAERLLRDADEVFAGLDDDDLLEAFSAHPRIGERVAASAETEAAGHTRWSAGEQSGTATAEEDTLAALTEGNRAYEERFGHVFLIRAAGRSAEEMLAALRERLDNDDAAELQVAAEQQRQITALRLDKLLREPRPATTLTTTDRPGSRP